MTTAIPNTARARFSGWETDATSSGVPFAGSYGSLQSARSIDDFTEPIARALGRIQVQAAPPQVEYATLVLWLQPPAAGSGLTFVVQVENPDIGLGMPEDVAISASSWPRLMRRRGPAPVASEGVFVVAHPVKHIFTKNLRIATAQLPPWIPHIVIDDRDLEPSDD
jgi:hypothetical protein